MASELIVRNNKDNIDVALLKSGRLVELHKILPEDSFSIGDIYLGQVKKTSPQLNAAFVNVGYEKDGFLHYHDLGPQYNSLAYFVKQTMSAKASKWALTGTKNFPNINKDGAIDDVLKKKENILVQVSKEPISTKGPRIVSEISLAGRYVVLMPFSNRISISQKIKSQAEKDRLKKLIKSIIPKNFGMIVRTVAEGKKVAELDADLTALISQWKVIHSKLRNAEPGTKIFGGISKLSSILRDILNDTFNKIIVDDINLYDELKLYLKNNIPSKEKILSRYNGSQPIFDRFHIEKQIKSSFGKAVSMKKGSYLIIEHTEAMHVIDVNSGNRTNKHETQEENALEVNLQAAAEVARQLRLRDMGGIIVVDFIDMHIAENRKMLTDTLREHMREDRAKHKILAPSRFGLIEITRQRVRPQITIKTRESCPSCNGSGEIEAPIVFVEQLKDKLDMLAQKKSVKEITLVAHPFVIAYLKKGFPSFQFKWSLKNRIFLYLRENHSFSFLEHSFINSKGQRIIFS